MHEVSHPVVFGFGRQMKVTPYGVGAGRRLACGMVGLLVGACAMESVGPNSVREVTIGILSRERPQSVSVQCETLRVFAEGTTETPGTTLEVEADGDSVLFRPSRTARTASLIVTCAEPLTITSPAGGPRRYGRRLEIQARRSALSLRVAVPFEAYVASVADAELGELLSANREPRELRRAMRIVVRSYALAGLHRHADEGYDFCDLTHCMHFPGLMPGAEAGEAGPVLLNPRTEQVLPAYFHSTCGGTLASPRSAWPEARDNDLYRSGPDGAGNCARSPHYRWRAEIETDDLLGVLPGVRSIQDIQLRRVQGRVSLIEVNDGRRTLRLSGMEFVSRAGRAWGWQRIKSNAFRMRRLSHERYLIEGRGLGHGVGLCQWGAARLAAEGATAEEIVRYYFPGADLVETRSP